MELLSGILFGFIIGVYVGTIIAAWACKPQGGE